MNTTATPAANLDPRPAANRRAIVAALEAVLASPEFQRAPALSRLLQFIVDYALAGDSASLKETVIGNALFERTADYDPKLDAVVRVTANRLRQQLERFYASDPRNGVRIELPRGSYVPVFVAAGEDLGGPAAGPGTSAVLSTESAAPPPLIKTRSRRWPLALAAVGLGVLCVCWVLIRHTQGEYARVKWTAHPFSKAGRTEKFADFSPDGQKVAFISDSADHEVPAVFVREISSEVSRRVTDSPLEESRPAWSPDGRQLAFLRLRGGQRLQVMLRDMATGAERQVAQIQGGSLWLCRVPRLSWSRDGQRLFTSAAAQPSDRCAVVSIEIANGAMKRVTDPPNSIEGDLEAAASPDGRSLAYIRNYSYRHSDIFVQDLSGGPARKLTKEQADIIGFAWSRQDKALIVTSDRVDQRCRLWEMPLSGAAPVRLTDGESLPIMPAVDPVHHRIIFSQVRLVSSIWLQGPKNAREIINNGAANSQPRISPDGQWLLYNSDRGGALITWISDSQGGYSRPLLRAPGTASDAEWSPDGHSIAFECREAGGSHDICLSDIRGTNIRRLTHGGDDKLFPAWTPDGEGVFYTSHATGRSEIYRQDLAGSSPFQITHSGGTHVAPSTGGRWLYITGTAEGVEAVPTKDGRIVDGGKVEVVKTASASTMPLEIAVSGESLLFVDSKSAGVPLLMESRRGWNQPRALYPLPGSANASSSGLCVAKDKDGIYLAHESYREDLDLLEAD